MMFSKASAKRGKALPPTVIHKLFHSLAGIHACGYYHGDARLQNATLVDDEEVWIDFMLCRYEPSQEGTYVLISSILLL